MQQYIQRTVFFPHVCCVSSMAAVGAIEREGAVECGKGVVESFLNRKPVNEINYQLISGLQCFHITF